MQIQPQHYSSKLLGPVSGEPVLAPYHMEEWNFVLYIPRDKYIGLCRMWLVKP